MTTELALFDTTELETANEAVLFCKEYLSETGQHALATNLEGLVPMTNVNLGEIVVGVLGDMLPRMRRGAAADYVRLALHATRKAVSESQTTQQPLVA